MTRVAAVDCGTNSIRLLVADVDSSSSNLVDLDRRMEITRLGEGVDDSGRLSEPALDRTFGVLRRYAKLIQELDAKRVRVVATSATRDAKNRDNFVSGIESILGVSPEVLSGDEEARLSFTGATRGLPADIPGPFLVVDIGGGSTEFVIGEDDVRAAVSADIGCVRMTERHFVDDPPTPREIEAARTDIDQTISRVAEVVPLQEARSVLGLAGSVTTVAGIALGLPAYDPTKIHLSRIRAEDVRAISEALLAADHDQRAAIPVMHPGRVDVIAAGALVLRCILDQTGFPVVVASEHDILDGLAWSLVASV
jgi:exopolyphosphatase / guanosine-5'-triphosphate,3'-diphosphate pyrophosphatase